MGHELMTMNVFLVVQMACSSFFGIKTSYFTLRASRNFKAHRFGRILILIAQSFPRLIIFSSPLQTGRSAHLIFNRCENLWH